MPVGRLAATHSDSKLFSPFPLSCFRSITRSSPSQRYPWKVFDRSAPRFRPAPLPSSRCWSSPDLARCLARNRSKKPSSCGWETISIFPLRLQRGEWDATFLNLSRRGVKTGPHQTPMETETDAQVDAPLLPAKARASKEAPGGLMKDILQGDGPSITWSPFRPILPCRGGSAGGGDGERFAGAGWGSAEAPEGAGSPNKLTRMALEDGILPQPPAVGAQLSPMASSPSTSTSPGETRDEKADEGALGGGSGLLFQEARNHLEEENEALRREVGGLRERIEALEEDVEDARDAARTSEEDHAREKKRLEDKVAQREAEAKAFRDAWRDGEVADPPPLSTVVSRLLMCRQKTRLHRQFSLHCAFRHGQVTRGSMWIAVERATMAMAIVDCTTGCGHTIFSFTHAVVGRSAVCWLTSRSRAD